MLWLFVLALLTAGGALALRSMRRAVAAGLIGEIADAIELMETHDLESALAQEGEGGVVPPVLSTLVYRSEAGRLSLLGPHVARLVASFYAAAEALQDELQALAAETSQERRAQRRRFAATQLRHVFDLGEDVLRELRRILSGRRALSLTRA